MKRTQQRFPGSNASAMPLNGHSYLVGQGWEGHGKGLRNNAITRPLAIPQKKTLAGLGKDRDEAFPFWDQCVQAVFFLSLGDDLFAFLVFSQLPRRPSK